MAKKDNMLPAATSYSISDHADASADYSVALEFVGPLPPPAEGADDIPRALPLDFDRIPTAKAVTAAVLGDLALPVVQPIAPKSKRPTRDTELEFERIKYGSISARARGSDGELFGTPQKGGKGWDGVLPRNWNGVVGKPVYGNGTDSSGTYGFSDSRDNSHELSAGSDMVDTLLDDGEETPDLRRSMDQSDWNSVEAEGEGREAAAQQQRRQVPERTTVKKGLCSRCLKGSWFTDKESCLVCDARYCSNCVLRAMGSMPEGRKCISCIGWPVAETKRKFMGRCSKLLRRLLSEEEIRQILKSEVSCEANQILPELVVVNGKPLRRDELALLRSCPLPPRDLRPGRYWYDDVSGMWGKEGHKPCQIISPNLQVGDVLKADASNGDTNVQINSRIITKRELWVLQDAGVQCDGPSSFWVNSDGSYRDEGMNAEKGNIWGKKRTKILCTLLSLPTPESPHPIERRLDHDKHVKFLEHHELHKLLLVGNDQSGTCTIYKQARALYNLPFSEAERENIKFMIQSKLYGYLAILLEAREQFEEESLLELRRQLADQPGPSDRSNEDLDEKTIYSLNSRLMNFSDWLITVMVSGNLETVFPAATREYAPYVEELWKSAAFQATYSRKNELELPRDACHLLDKAVEIAKAGYDPSDTDILYAGGITSSNGVVHLDFSFPKTPHDDLIDSINQHSHVDRYQLIRVHGKSLGESCKWLEMFEDVNVILFCVSLTEYDEYEVDKSNSDEALVNKMLVSKRLFESIVTHHAFKHMNFLLVLNKFDLLEDKIEHAPLTQCEWFKDFNLLLSRHHKSQSNPNSALPLAQQAFCYIACKFKELFKSLTGRKLYVYQTSALEQQKTVDGALRYARDIINWEEEKLSLNFNDISSESIEASTV